MTRTIVFTTSTCSWCKRAKRYLTENGVAFKEVNVERDRNAAREIARRTGQMGVPVIKIGGRWITGFDRAAIDRELALRAS